MEFKLIVKTPGLYGGECQISEELHPYLDKRLFQVHGRVLKLSKLVQLRALKEGIATIKKNYPDLSFFVECISSEGGLIPWETALDTMQKHKEYWSKQIELINQNKLDEAFEQLTI